MVVNNELSFRSLVLANWDAWKRKPCSSIVSTHAVPALLIFSPLTSYELPAGASLLPTLNLLR